jgi:hypothetical protein
MKGLSKGQLYRTRCAQRYLENYEGDGSGQINLRAKTLAKIFEELLDEIQRLNNELSETRKRGVL